jgi:hypothetical protein
MRVVQLRSLLWCGSAFCPARILGLYINVAKLCKTYLFSPEAIWWIRDLFGSGKNFNYREATLEKVSRSSLSDDAYSIGKNFV